jgi:hypothetical protein
MISFCRKVPGRRAGIVEEETRPVAAGKFPQAFQAGAKITYGTDSGVYPQRYCRQFKMVEWGMKPIDAIRRPPSTRRSCSGGVKKWARLKKAATPM